MIETLLPGEISTAVAVFLIASSFFTSLVTAAFGIGGGLTLLGIMTVFMPVAAVIPIHGAVQFGSNAGRAFLRRSYIALPELAAFSLGAVAGAGMGAAVVVELPEQVLLLGLGLFVLTVTWVRLPYMQAMGLRGFAATGLVTTFLTMFFGATGPLNVAAFEKTFPDRRRMVATLAALQTVSHILKIVAFGTAGFVFGPWIPLTVAMIVTGYAGTVAGSRILDRADEKSFRIVMRIIMTIIALDMIRRGFGLSF